MGAKGKRQPDADGRVHAVLYAAVHGDEAACRRFGITDRSLRNYRAAAREEGSELSEAFRRYAEALDPERRAADFADWLLGQVRDASALLMRKGEALDARNPEALRVINEHVGTLLDHKAALDYIARLLGPGHDPESDPPAAGAGE